MGLFDKLKKAFGVDDKKNNPSENVKGKSNEKVKNDKSTHSVESDDYNFINNENEESQNNINNNINYDINSDTKSSEDKVNISDNKSELSDSNVESSIDKNDKNLNETINSKNVNNITSTIINSNMDNSKIGDSKTNIINGKSKKNCLIDDDISDSQNFINIHDKDKINEDLRNSNIDLNIKTGDTSEILESKNIILKNENDMSDSKTIVNISDDNNIINEEGLINNDKKDLQKYDSSLKKTRSGFRGRINALLANFHSVDEKFFDQLEEMLIESDVGFNAALKICDDLRKEVKFQNVKKKSDVSKVIVEKLVNLYEDGGNSSDQTLRLSKDGLTIFLFVGVNGVGKTTTIGKLAYRYKNQGKKVVLAAGDTFRAGAIQQLKEWGRRVEVPVVSKSEKSDPASVVYDAIMKAKKENYDILLIDTAGRLQNKVNLMKELEKIKKIIKREVPTAPHEVLLALDATTGQNALLQAKQFKEVTDVTGIILTKLDGTARGGIILAIRNELHIPVKLVGLGEKIDDLRNFNTESFAYGLFKGLIVSREES